MLATVPTHYIGSGLGLELEPNHYNDFTTWITRTVAFGPISTSKPGLCKPRCFAPIQYLSSDHIVTWSLRRLCSFSRSFTSRAQMYNPTNICWVAIENPRNSLIICPYFTATQRISVRSQMWKREVTERLKLHNLCTDHVTIRSELEYLIAAKSVGPAKWTRGLVPTRPNIAGFQSGPSSDPALVDRFSSSAVTNLDRSLSSGSNPDQCGVTRNRC